MNKILLFVLLLPLFAFSQNDSLPRNAGGRYEYTGVINVDSASADKLYSNAKIYVVEAFKNGKDVTQLNDDNAKTAAGSGTLRISFGGLNPDNFVRFKFIIQCKDGRYRYIINNFELANPGDSPVLLENEKALKHYATPNMRKKLFIQVKEGMEKFIQSLNENMSSQTASTKDW